MFFEKNKKLLIAAGSVAVLWLILFYSFVAPNWKEAQDLGDDAHAKRKAWEDAANNPKERAAAEKHHNEFKTRPIAQKELEASSKRTEKKFDELHQMEFGTHETLKAFSVSAVGAGGDTADLLNRKLKDTAKRVNAVLKKQVPPDVLTEKLKVKFDDSARPLDLLRLAMIDRFLNACKDVKDPGTKECKIEELVQVDYYPPAVIEPPESKSADRDEDTGEEKRPRSNSKKDKNAEKSEELDKLVQVPMKVLIRAPERYINQLLLELQKPTPANQSGDEQHSYFCLQGFHVAVHDAVPNQVDLCVGVSALLRESEIKALNIKLKSDNRGGRLEDLGI